MSYNYWRYVIAKLGIVNPIKIRNQIKEIRGGFFIEYL